MKFFSNLIKSLRSRKFRNNGLNSLFMRDYKVAEENFLKAIEIYPEDEISLLNLGYSLTSEKRFDEAIINLQKAVDCASPVNPAPAIALAMAYYETGKIENANVFLKEALKIDVKHPAVHYYLGLILLKEERFDEATEEFEEVIAEKPTFVQARLLAIGETWLMDKKSQNKKFNKEELKKEIDEKIDDN